MQDKYFEVFCYIVYNKKTFPTIYTASLYSILINMPMCFTFIFSLHTYSVIPA